MKNKKTKKSLFIAGGLVAVTIVSASVFTISNGQGFLSKRNFNTIQKVETSSKFNFDLKKNNFNSNRFSPFVVPKEEPSIPWWCISEEELEAQRRAEEERWAEENEDDGGPDPDLPRFGSIGTEFYVPGSSNTSIFDPTEKKKYLDGRYIVLGDDEEDDDEGDDNGDDGPRVVVVDDPWSSGSGGTVAPGSGSRGGTPNPPAPEDPEEPEEPEPEVPEVWVGAQCGCEDGEIDGTVLVEDEELPGGQLEVECPENFSDSVDLQIENDGTIVNVYAYTPAEYQCSDEWECPEGYDYDWDEIYEDCDGYDLAYNEACEGEEPSEDFLNACDALTDPGYASERYEENLEEGMVCVDEEICADFIDQVNNGTFTQSNPGVDYQAAFEACSNEGHSSYNDWYGAHLWP